MEFRGWLFIYGIESNIVKVDEDQAGCSEVGGGVSIGGDMILKERYPR